MMRSDSLVTASLYLGLSNTSCTEEVGDVVVEVVEMVQQMSNIAFTFSR